MKVEEGLDLKLDVLVLLYPRYVFLPEFSPFDSAVYMKMDLQTSQKRF